MNQQDKDTERLIGELHSKIENLKIQYNLYFSRELRVPPEKERVEMEALIRKLLINEQKSTRLKLIIQNLSSKFWVYNNLWKKKMNEIETGAVILPMKSSANPLTMGKKVIEGAANPAIKELNVNLNNEDSFELFAEEFNNMFPQKSALQQKIVDNLKLKMISENIIDAKISLSLKNGKVNIKLKRTI